MSKDDKKSRRGVKYKSFNHKELPDSKIDKEKPIEFLENVPLRVSVELSKKNIKMSDLLNFQVGSIIELDKFAGEPMDILINREYLAKGEIIVQNGNYAVRLTDMTDKKEVLNEKYNEDDEDKP